LLAVRGQAGRAGKHYTATGALEIIKMDRPDPTAASAALSADTQWISTVEEDLFPSLHPGIVMGHVSDR
jgi:hypothetical protein